MSEFGVHGLGKFPRISKELYFLKKEKKEKGRKEKHEGRKRQGRKRE